MRAGDRAARERASAPTMTAGPTPAAAADPRGDGSFISDSEDDSLAKSGFSESERGVGNNDVYDDDDCSLPPKLTFLRELHQLQPILMLVLVSQDVRGNLARD